jgi:hypothetical protein
MLNNFSPIITIAEILVIIYENSKLNINLFITSKTTSIKVNTKKQATPE